jgi:class 3 adenylate cyclase
VALQRAVPTLNENVAELDLPPLRFGIGLNQGAVVAAHVGTKLRRQYDVVGDTVNIAARLCSLAGAGEIVLTKAVADETDKSPATLEPMGIVPLKGVRRAIEVFKWCSPAASPASGPTDVEVSSL